MVNTELLGVPYEVLGVTELYIMIKVVITHKPTA
jgi:hypothetical protein